MSKHVDRNKSGLHVSDTARASGAQMHPTCDPFPATDSHWPTGVTMKAACAEIAAKRAQWDAGIIVVPPDPAKKHPKKPVPDDFGARLAHPGTLETFGGRGRK